MSLAARPRVALPLAAAATLALAAFAPSPSPSPFARLEEAYRANNRGVALLEQYRYDEALASFRSALATEPSLAIAHANLAIALLNLPKPEEARTEAEAALKALPSAGQPPYVMGLAARATGAVPEAEAAFRRVLEIDPRDVGAHVNLGQILMQERRYPDAVVEFRAASEADPTSATVIYNLGLALARAGDTAGSQQAMERFRQLRDAGYGTTLGQAYPDQGRYAEAITSTGAEPGLVDRNTPPVRFVDVTAQRLGVGQGSAGTSRTKSATVGPGGVTLADLDGDGRLDLVTAGPEGLRLYLGSPQGLREASAAWGLPKDAAAIGAVAGDYDNDGKLDLLVLRSAGVLLLHNDGQRFSEAPAAAGLAPGPGPFVTAAFVDADHDGDLDVLLAGGGPRRLFQNDGFGPTNPSATPPPSHFKDVTARAGIGDALPTLAIVPTDFDNHRDVDLLLLTDTGRPQLFQNRREGTFRDVAAETGLDVKGPLRCVAAGDVNKDGFTDFFFGAADGPDLLAASDGKGHFVVGPAPAGQSGALRAQILDYDGDGLLDLLALTSRGPRLLRNLGTEWADVTSAAFGSIGGSWAGPNEPALATGDLDGDGDTDLVVRLPSGDLRILDNQGTRNHALAVRLAGLVSNRSAAGAKVEVRAGSLHQRLETYAVTPAPAPADVLFGLGPREAADAVRVLWPSGVLQSELMAPPGPGADGPRRTALAIKELDRKPSSCPYLYAWNGRRFEFLTDFMGGGEMGYREEAGRFNHPDPDEYVRIRDDQLVAKDGRLELRVTNELEEGLFVDQLALLAIPHPGDVEVYPDEGLKEPAPGFRLVAVRGAHPPRAATDDRGRDVRERLAALDHRFVDGFALRRIRGYAEEHTLTLDLGADADDETVLLLTGWTDYAFSSDNMAAEQAGFAMEQPSLQAEDEAGRWQTVVADLGIPVGRPQTLVVEMAGRWRGPSRRVRIVTNMRVYWDQAQVAVRAHVPLTPVALPLVRASLRERGFSAETSPDGREPFGYDYERVSLASPWKAFPGRYTRTGDVRELLARIDDLFVISRPGDEIALSFEPSPVPAGEGRRITYLLHADGFSKEMDLHSASPDLLEPLPYHGMPGYPYAPPHAYPMTPEKREVMERYNTRVVRAPIPSLDALLAQEARR